MPTLHYRGPGEPGGDDDTVCEAVDGIIRRWIEISPDGAAECVENYPVAIDMADMPDYVWPIPEQEFNEARLRHCSGCAPAHPGGPGGVTPSTGGRTSGTLS